MVMSRLLPWTLSSTSMTSLVSMSMHAPWNRTRLGCRTCRRILSSLHTILSMAPSLCFRHILTATLELQNLPPKTFPKFPVPRTSSGKIDRWPLSISQCSCTPSFCRSSSMTESLRAVRSKRAPVCVVEVTLGAPRPLAEWRSSGRGATEVSRVAALNSSIARSERSVTMVQKSSLSFASCALCPMEAAQTREMKMTLERTTSYDRPATSKL
mmetsp:Transcript_70793/g.152489  ORF Transcript_70793/g.152489 Transcript_70793/m.152489 type:complete len:212 (+) Transcript_70793:342-977(+)